MLTLRYIAPLNAQGRDEEKKSLYGVVENIDEPEEEVALSQDYVGGLVKKFEEQLGYNFS